VCYIAGKVLQIRQKIQNSQKNSPAAGSSVYFLGLQAILECAVGIIYIIHFCIILYVKFEKILIKNKNIYTYSCLGKFVPPRKIKKFVLHCWKSAPNTTEDQKFRLRRAVQYTSIRLPGEICAPRKIEKFVLYIHC
jgi:hypothetical protein